MLKSRTYGVRSCLVLIVGVMLLVSGVIFWTWVSNPCTFRQCLYGDKPRLAVSRDGNVAAIAGQEVSDPTVRRGVRYPVDFYDTGSGALISTYDESQIDITNMALTGDGAFLACNTSNGSLQVIDVRSGAEVYIVSDGDSLDAGYPRWNADGTQIVFLVANWMDIFTLNSNRRSFASFSVQGSIAAYDWSDDGSIIALSVIDIRFLRQDTVREERIAVFEFDEAGQFNLLRSFDSPSGDWIEVNADGSLIATLRVDGLLITNAENGSVQMLKNPNGDESLLSVAWNPVDDRLAAGSAEHIIIWDLASGDVVQTIDVELPGRDIFWSADGQDVFHVGPQGVYRSGTLISVPPASWPTAATTAESSN